MLPKSNQSLWVANVRLNTNQSCFKWNQWQVSEDISSVQALEMARKYVADGKRGKRVNDGKPGITLSVTVG